MHKSCFTISFISCLHMFRAHVLIIRRSKLQYTASGIITPIGVMICFTLSFISCLYMFRAHVFTIRRSKLHYKASGIITPIGVMMPKAVMMNTCARNMYRHEIKLIVKQIFASSWLNTEINMLRCTVSKTSKLVIVRRRCPIYNYNYK